MNIDKIKQSKLTPLIVLILVILVQLTRIIYSFAFLKQDYHPDETWSFGLANSYYEPYIYQDADETTATHIGYWFSAEELKNYLTVEPIHRFSYDSVWYNQSKDLHPPLFYALLHTICSLFPGQFSFWFGFVINIVAFIVLQIYLYKLSREVFKSSIFAIITCAYFGFTSGALSMFVFVRMYALATTFATVTAYYHARLYNDGDLKRNLPHIFVVTFVGALTHHYFLVFAGALSACFCLYYLIRKEIKKFVIYSFTLLASVGISVLAFPATIYHALGRRGEIKKLPLEWQSVMSLNCITGELTGIQFKYGKTPFVTVLLCVLISVLILTVPLCFLFRKEIWFKNFIITIKRYCAALKVNIKDNSKNFNLYPVFLLIVSVCVWIVVFNSISMILMENYTDRYLFEIYPVFSLVIVYSLRTVLNVMCKKRNIVYISLSVLCMCFAALSNILFPCIYLLQRDYSVRSEYKNSDVMLVTVANNLLTQIAKDVLDSNLVYMNKPESIVYSELVLPDDDKEIPVFLLLDEACLTQDDADDKENLNSWLQIASYTDNKKNRWTREKIEQIIIDKNPYNKCEYIGQDVVAGYTVSVYRLR